MAVIRIGNDCKQNCEPIQSAKNVQETLITLGPSPNRKLYSIRLCESALVNLEGSYIYDLIFIYNF